MAQYARRTHSRGKRRSDTDWADSFIRHLKANGGCVLYAAEDAGIHRNQVYSRRLKDEDFALRMADAFEYCTETLEKEATRRALAGSDFLLSILLRACRPSKYQPKNTVVKQQGIDETQLSLITAAVQTALKEVGLTRAERETFSEVLEEQLKKFEEVAS